MIDPSEIQEVASQTNLNPYEHMLDDQYPIGNRLGAMVVWQLGEFREQRAVERLTELSEDRLGILVEAANDALAKTRGGD